MAGLIMVYFIDKLEIHGPVSPSPHTYSWRGGEFNTGKSYLLYSLCVCVCVCVGVCVCVSPCDKFVLSTHMCVCVPTYTYTTSVLIRS